MNDPQPHPETVPMHEQVSRVMGEEARRWRQEDQQLLLLRIPWWRQPIWWLVILLFGIVAVFLGFTVIAPVLEPDPLIYRNLPFPVDGPVRSGEPIPLTVERCATGEITDFSYSRILHRVGEGSNYNLPDGSAVLIPGCMRSFTRTTLVPPETEPGTYELIGVVRVQGAWREHKVIYRSAPFEVRK